MLQVILSGVGILLLGASTVQAAGQQSPNAAPPAASPQRALLNQYCVVCHNEKLKTAGLMLDKMDVDNVSAGAPVWEKVVRKLRAAAMPPVGMPRPDKATYDGFAAYLETTLDRAAAAKPNPGRPAVHRLNRAEYANAIRDLLAVDTAAMDIGSVLPTDDSGYGFDNNGDVLTVSPLLMEGYMTASRKISRVAIGDRAARPVFETYEVPRYIMQEERMSEDLPLGSRGGAAIRHYFPLDGEYTIKIRLQRNGKTYILGIEHPQQVDFRLDGERVKLFRVGGERESKPGAIRGAGFDQGEYEHYLMTADDNLEVRLPIQAGTHVLGVSFPNITAEPEGIYLPHVTDYAYAMDYGHPDMEPAVGSITIGGPYNAGGAGETPSRRKIFVCNPTDVREEDPCAKRILSSLARRAYRRPVTERDVAELLSLYKTGRKEGSFEEGIQAGVQRILVDPEFLFRIERDPPSLAPGAAYRVSDLELASRLSFFLWSSLPDDELLNLAERGKLKDSVVLEQQVRRMLADPRSKALVSNFAGQWLYLRNVQKVWPNPDVFPYFDVSLREAFQQETELFFESMLRENRSVLDLLNADFTFVNEPLARHYGIPGIYGNHFRRITVQDENRKGLLGQASILTVTSYATRTAPTIRGRWLLENVLGTPPPPPPPNVPSLDVKKGDNGLPLTMRQQMEQHRANPVCASCHKVMDPLGFALENFDATGKWRATDGGSPIDSSGITPDGVPFQGPAELRKLLLTHPEQFVLTVTEKLLTYALGRGVEYYDAPAIRKIMREAAPGNYRWSSLMTGIIQSTPFQMRRSREP